MKIGLYGGTFDPIHHGHLILARDAMEAHNLDKIIFIPNRQSPHKQNNPPAPAELRKQMLEAAIAGEACFEMDDYELTRNGFSYTIDTVRYMKQRYPEAAFFYIIGEDNLVDLDSWREAEQLKQLVKFVVLTRSGKDKEITSLSRQIEISSTEIRQRLAEGRSIRYFVPDKVLDIILKNQLYARTHL